MWSDNESKEDLLGFQYLADGVISIVNNESLLPATIGVFGDWGGGKSTLIELVKAQLSSKERKDSGIVVLSFNGWLFEGYEGAKTALMGTILEELEQHETFKRCATDKAKSLLKSLFRRVNWLKTTLGAGKLIAAYLSGGTAAPMLAVGGTADLLSVGKDVINKAKNLDPDEVQGYIKDDKKEGGNADAETRCQIQNFRRDFKDLLDESKITRLIVVIDDLDRCSPDTIIPTLEAIKLFLFVPKSAFIIGADEELVRYAVRRRFPELPGDRREVGRDYLEKLIQFPIRIPTLGRAEVESYMSLLFVMASEQLSTEQKKGAYQKTQEANPSALTTACFNVSVAREMLKPIPVTLEDSLMMVERIAPLLGTIMNGNPRQCKRFLNTLLLRLEMARSRNITLQQRVLAKVMLLEYFRPESFKRLAEIQFAQDGRPNELRDMEHAVKQDVIPTTEESEEPEPVPALEIQKKPAKKKAAKQEQIELPPEFNLWIADPWIREWLSTEPMLAGEDLSTYYYFSRDNLGMLGTAGQRLSVVARRVLDKLKSASDAVRLSGRKEIKQLSESDANAVFESLVERAKREEDLGAETASLKPMIAAAEERSGLLSRLIVVVKALPESVLPVSAPVDIQGVCKGNVDAERAFKEVLEMWSRNTVNLPLASAAKTTLVMLTGTH